MERHHSALVCASQWWFGVCNEPDCMIFWTVGGTQIKKLPQRKDLGSKYVIYIVLKIYLFTFRVHMKGCGWFPLVTEYTSPFHCMSMSSRCFFLLNWQLIQLKDISLFHASVLILFCIPHICIMNDCPSSESIFMRFVFVSLSICVLIA